MRGVGGRALAGGGHRHDRAEPHGQDQCRDQHQHRDLDHTPLHSRSPIPTAAPPAGRAAPFASLPAARGLRSRPARAPVRLADPRAGLHRSGVRGSGHGRRPSLASRGTQSCSFLHRWWCLRCCQGGAWLGPLCRPRRCSGKDGWLGGMGWRPACDLSSALPAALRLSVASPDAVAGAHSSLGAGGAEVVQFPLCTTGSGALMLSVVDAWINA